MVVLPFAGSLIPVIVALAAVIVVYAYRQLFQSLLEALAGAVPVLGNTLIAGINVIMADIEARATPIADAAVTPLAEAIAAIPTHAAQLADQLIAALWAIVYWVERTAATAGAGAAGTATAALAATIAAIQASQSLMINQLVPQLQASILSVADQARMRLDDLTGRVGAIEAAAVGAGGAALAAAVATLEGAIAAAETRAILAARGIEAGVRDYLEAQLVVIRAESANALAGLRGQIGALVGELEQAIPGLRARIEATEVAIPLEAARLTTLEQTLQKYLDECGDPICDQYKPDIPNLQAVTQILETGLLAAWLIDAINDPNGAARRADAVVNAPIQAASNALMSAVRAA